MGESPSVVDSGLDPVSHWFLWQLSQANGSLWRRGALETIGGWNEHQSRCQDNEIYARALRAGLRFGFRPSAGAIYRMWSDQTVSRKDPAATLRARVDLMEEMCGWLEATGGWTRARRRSAGRAFLEVCRQWAGHDAAAATRLFREKRRERLIAFNGPAAPPSYSMVCHLLGFRAAEKLAALIRKQ